MNPRGGRAEFLDQSEIRVRVVFCHLAKLRSAIRRCKMDIEIFRQAYRDVSMYTLRQTFVSCDRRLTERPVAPAVDEAILDVHRVGRLLDNGSCGPPAAAASTTAHEEHRI